MIFSGAWTANPGLVHAGEANEAQARGTGVPRSTQCCLSDLVRWPCLSSNQWRRLMVRQKTDGSRWFSTRSARSMPQMFTRWIKQNCTHATPEEFTEIDTCHVFFCRACSLSLCSAAKLSESVPNACAFGPDCPEMFIGRTDGGVPGPKKVSFAPTCGESPGMGARRNSIPSARGGRIEAFWWIRAAESISGGDGW